MPADRIAAYGESLGSGQGVRLAAERPVAGVILEAPLTSTVDVARQVYFWLPLGLLIVDRYNVERDIAAVKTPLLILHGEQDEVIPVEMGRRVYPHEAPYSDAELVEHMNRFPQGQFIAEHVPTRIVTGAHFTLRLEFADFHSDDPWDVLTDHGTFDDDNPNGHTLYGADVFVSPDHQHHGLAHALTDVARALVVAENAACRDAKLLSRCFPRVAFEPIVESRVHLFDKDTRAQQLVATECL